MHFSYPQTNEPDYFPELEILIFGDFKDSTNLPSAAFLPLQASELSNFMVSLIFEQMSDAPPKKRKTLHNGDKTNLKMQTLKHPQNF